MAPSRPSAGKSGKRRIEPEAARNKVIIGLPLNIVRNIAAVIWGAMKALSMARPSIVFLFPGATARLSSAEYAYSRTQRAHTAALLQAQENAFATQSYEFCQAAHPVSQPSVQ